MNCEFCNARLSNKWALEAHKKRAKYCLTIQQELSDDVLNPTEFECYRCKKRMNSGNKARHLKKCTSDFSSKLEERDAEIERLKKQIEQLQTESKVLVLQTELRVRKEFAKQDSECIYVIA